MSPGLSVHTYIHMPFHMPASTPAHMYARQVLREPGLVAAPQLGTLAALVEGLELNTLEHKRLMSVVLLGLQVHARTCVQACVRACV